MTEQERNLVERLMRKDPVGTITFVRDQPGLTPEARCFLAHLEAEARYLVEMREQAKGSA